MKRRLLFALGVIVVTGVAYFLGVEAGGLIESYQVKKWKANRDAERQLILENSGGLQIGEKMPNYFLHDIDGNLIELQKFAGAQTNFMFCYLIADCEACREQIEILQNLVVPESKVNSIIILSFSNPFELREIRNSYSIHFPILYDHFKEYGANLGITEFPFSILTDSNLTITDLLPNVMLEEEIKEVLNLEN